MWGRKLLVAMLYKPKIFVYSKNVFKKCATRYKRTSSKFNRIKHVNLLNYINRATVLNIINSDKRVMNDSYILLLLYIEL